MEYGILYGNIGGGGKAYGVWRWQKNVLLRQVRFMASWGS